MKADRKWHVVCGMLIMIGVLAATLALARGATAQETLGLSADDLKALIYGDSIPGFRQVSPVRGGDGPQVMLDVPHKKWGPRSSIEAAWVSGDGLNFIELRLTVVATLEVAAATAEYLVAGSSAPPPEHTGDRRIGDRSWSRVSPGEAIVAAAIGRALVFINALPRDRRSRASDPWVVSPLDASIGDIVTTLARGIEWNVRQRPDLMAGSDRTERLSIVASGRAVPGGSALTFRSVTWAPLSAFEGAGAKVTWNAKTNRATVAYGDRTVELRPFHREASSGGRKLNLGATVLLGPDGPVVPLHKLAAALGIKVRSTKTTIRLG